MKNNARKVAICVYLMITILFGSASTCIPAYAAGEETLPMGNYTIGTVTFTDTNLTPKKTMPSGASKWKLTFRFKKATIDAGVGNVKLTIKIKRPNGTVYYAHPAVSESPNTTDGYTQFDFEISVSTGGTYQIWMDASSVNPSMSNGNYRSITVIMQSYIS